MNKTKIYFGSYFYISKENTLPSFQNVKRLFRKSRKSHNAEKFEWGPFELLERIAVTENMKKRKGTPLW